MATNDYVLDSLKQLDRYVRLMGAAATTFDDNQQPAPIHDAEDVRRICISVRNQCVALRAASLTLTPELLELDLFFFFANMSVEVHELEYANTPSPVISLRRDLRQSPASGRYAGRGYA